MIWSLLFPASADLQSEVVMPVVQSAEIVLMADDFEVDYYDNGCYREAGYLVNGEKYGYWQYFYPNGTQKKKGHFLNGQKNDYWIYYGCDRTCHAGIAPWRPQATGDPRHAVAP